MCETNRMGVNISAQKKQIELTALTPPIMLPLPDKAKDRLPPAAITTTSTAIAACLNTQIQGTRILEPHSVSTVKFKVDEKHVPLRELVLESNDGDGRFVPILVDGHKVFMEGGLHRSISQKGG